MMIESFIFDLDGTLVQSEMLNAHSCAIAVPRLRGLGEMEAKVEWHNGTSPLGRLSSQSRRGWCVAWVQAA